MNTRQETFEEMKAMMNAAKPKRKDDSIQQDGELTAIHIMARANVKKYIEGWWVSLQPEIFIRPVGANDKLGLVYAFNIPIAPDKYYFKSPMDSLLFTLFFPALPKHVTHIDIIEKIGGSTRDYFNFYSAPMDIIRTSILQH